MESFPLPKKYAAADQQVVDYEYYRLPGISKWFRGPPLADTGAPPICFLGAASCFGRLVQRPYATAVPTMLGASGLNLGYGGARAPFYSSDAALMRVINGSSCVVVELFSARGTTTSRIEARANHYAAVRWTGSGDDYVFADKFFRLARAKMTPDAFSGLVEEIREVYVADVAKLLNSITAPKILFWFSQRSPDTDADFGAERSFPHFVNARCLERLRPLADGFVSVISKAGLPSPLFARDTKEPVPLWPGRKEGEPHLNNYYPSPEMHEAATAALVPAVRRFITRAKQPRPTLPAAAMDAKGATGQPAIRAAVLNRFLMVVGCPRSGTAAIGRLLNRHPRIALGVERYNKKIAQGRLEPEDFTFDRFFNVQPGDTWYKDFSSFAQVYDQLRSKFPTTGYVGDKFPRGYLHYDFLAKVLPGCKFVVAMRDVFDVATSYEKRKAQGGNWPANRDARMAVRDWNESIHRTLAAARQYPVYAVSFEQLFRERAPLTSLARFLGLNMTMIEKGRDRAADQFAAKRGGLEQPSEPNLTLEDREYIERTADFTAFEALMELCCAKNPAAPLSNVESVRE